MRFLALFLLITAVACTDSTAPKQVATEIHLSPSSVVLNDGDTTRLVATVLDQHGKPLAELPRGTSLIWSSSVPAVISVVEGQVTALRPGTATVTVRAGSARGSVEANVRAVPSAMVPAGGDAQRGTVATVLTDSLAVRVTDRHGEGVSGVTVSFRVAEGAGSVSAATVSTGTGGTARVAWTLGSRSGQQMVIAEASGINGGQVTFHASAEAGAPTLLQRLGGDGQSGLPGSQLSAPLAVRVLDGHGNAVSGAEALWSVTSGGGSISAARTKTDTTGVAQIIWTLGREVGRQTVTASVGTLAAITFAATGVSAETPVLDAVAPSILTPGTTATITGRNFSANAAENAVTIAGVSATVIQASTSQLRVQVPVRSALPCEPARGVPVTVSVGQRSGTRSHPLDAAADRALAVGQSITLARDDIRCTRLLQGAARYLISVLNTSTSGSSAFQLRGSTGGASTARLPATSSLQPARAAVPLMLQALTLDAGDGHAATLAANRSLIQSLAPRFRRGSAAVQSRIAAPLPARGDTLPFRIPTLGTSTICSNFTEVRARAVYVGKHAVVFEDVAAPLAGRMDSTYQAIGEEYDGSMHGMLLANFGNPLAVDALTDANGRLFMLFSKVVNDSERGVAGFVFSGDLFSRADCSASNQSEIFYARVPTNPERGFANSDTRDQWYRWIRSTVVHEVKHLVSFAERLAANARTWEESWLEESTARLSEEIWARGIYGYKQRQNTSYRESLHCETRPSTPECNGKPLVMIDHMDGLYDYATAAGALTPLRSVRSGDASYYGSGWSLVRWAIDHSTTSESAFLRALIKDPNLSGVRNLEARTGRSFAELLADWSLALAADDRSGFTPIRPQLTFPSWNLPDVFAGMNRDFSRYWPNATPLAGRQLNAASFSVEVPDLRGGAASLFELAGDGTGAPVVELRNPGGGAPATSLNISIVRVQ